MNSRGGDGRRERGAHRQLPVATVVFWVKWRDKSNQRSSPKKYGLIKYRCHVVPTELRAPRLVQVPERNACMGSLYAASALKK